MRNRLVAVLAVAVACLVALPSPAFAGMGESWPHVVYKEDSGDTRRVLVAATDGYSAAACVIGVDPTGIDSNHMSQLSDSSKCPHFYAIAMAMFNVGDWDNVGSWVPVSTYQYLPLEANEAWEGSVSISEISLAKAEYDKVNDGFWGSGGGEFGGYVEVSLAAGCISCPSSDVGFVNQQSNFRYIATNATFDGSSVSEVGGTTVYSIWQSHKNYVASARCYVPKSLYSLIYQRAQEGYDIVVDGCLGRVYFGSDFTVEYINVNSSNKRWCIKASTINYYPVSSKAYYDSAGLYFVLGSDVGSVGSVSSKAELYYYNFMNDGEGVVAIDDGTSDDDSGVTWGTDIDWYTETSDGGAAGGTTIVNEGDTIYNSETNTYTTNNNIDVEPITQRLDVLNQISAQIGIDLRTFNDSMTKELNDLEWWLQKIYYVAYGINGVLESIRNDMANLDRSTSDLPDLSTIETGITSILNKLDSSAEQSGVDLSSVTTLVDDVESQLDTIADRIGNLVNGTPSVPKIEPTNTVVTDDENTIGKQVGQKAEELSRRFPFSLPWDIQFILSLLVREPAAPVFDLPVIGSDDAVCHVDLSDWEPVAVVCRQATKILFALGLALRTRQLVSSWGSSGD